MSEYPYDPKSLRVRVQVNRPTITTTVRVSENVVTYRMVPFPLTRRERFVIWLLARLNRLVERLP